MSNFLLAAWLHPTQDVVSPVQALRSSFGLSHCHKNLVTAAKIGRNCTDTELWKPLCRSPLRQLDELGLCPTFRVQEAAFPEAHSLGTSLSDQKARRLRHSYLKVLEIILICI